MVMILPIVTTDVCNSTLLGCCYENKSYRLKTPSRKRSHNSWASSPRDYKTATVVSALTPLSALPLRPPKYATPVNINPSTTPKTTGDVSVITSYRLTEGTLAPPARVIAQGLPPGIPTDSALEVVGQMESMNLLDSSSITDGMRAVWSTDLAKKYLHLPLALLNEAFEVEALTAVDMVLSAPAALQIWDPTSLDGPSSLLPMELFAPPGWTRSCWTVSCHRWQLTPSAPLWRKPVATCGPQQLLPRHQQQRRWKPKHWQRLLNSNPSPTPLENHCAPSMTRSASSRPCDF
uniref:Uncharacterized protein n=1 Tax=Romanomermis culicivorax TaxID=13658 RepID=A0A915J881_ROMCU